MNSIFTREQLLEVAKASPAAVARHDREAWIDLFATDYAVEDPVGSKPHQPDGEGRKPLERFFDTFIAPNNIAFHIDQDIVSGNTVVRDVTIELRMAANVTAFVPMHVVYEMTDEYGVPRISRLRAHWELLPMVKQVLGMGWAGMMSFSSLGFRMMKIMGIRGTLEFARGFQGIRNKGKDAANQFAEAVNNKDVETLVSLFDEQNEGIAFPAHENPIAPEASCEHINTELNVTKLLAAGQFVSFTFSGNESKGVGFFRFDPKTKKIQSARFYID